MALVTDTHTKKKTLWMERVYISPCFVCLELRSANRSVLGALLFLFLLKHTLGAVPASVPASRIYPPVGMPLVKRN